MRKQLTDEAKKTEEDFGSFEGLIIVFVFYAFCFSLIHFSRELGIKRGREIASKEYGKKLNSCQKIIVGEK